MGILSRLTGSVTPQKKATDDVLLLHGLLLMSSADGAMEDGELDTVQAFFNTLPEFNGKDFHELLEQCNKVISKYGNLKESVKALGELSNDKVRVKCFILCADIAMSSGDVDESEEEMLEAMQRILKIDDDFARTAVEIISIKYTK